MTIAEALTRLTDNTGASDVKIAAAVGVTQKTVERWRTGRKVPRGHLLVRLIQTVPGLSELLRTESPPR